MTRDDSPHPVSTDAARLSSLFRKWITRVQRYQLAHRFAAKGKSRAHIFMGIPTIVISTVVGTSIFASLESATDFSSRLVFGLLSLLAALLSALQTFLGFEELSNKHRWADSGYSAIRQRLEELAFSPPSTSAELASTLAEIRADMERLARESPIVPERYWQRARRVLSQQTPS